MHHVNKKVQVTDEPLIAQITRRARFLFVLVMVLAAVALALPIVSFTRAQASSAQSNAKKGNLRIQLVPRNRRGFDAQIAMNAIDLLEDGRQTQEIQVLTVTYGAKVDDSIFKNPEA